MPGFQLTYYTGSNETSHAPKFEWQRKIPLTVRYTKRIP
jgi:hypothetical protein